MQTKTTLNTLGRHNRVRICWVPGHEGFEGNDKADELARKGSERGKEHITSEIHPPLSHAWTVIGSKTNNVLMRTWENMETCRTSRLFGLTIIIRGAKNY